MADGHTKIGRQSGRARALDTQGILPAIFARRPKGGVRFGADGIVPIMDRQGGRNRSAAVHATVRDSCVSPGRTLVAGRRLRRVRSLDRGRWGVMVMPPAGGPPPSGRPDRPAMAQLVGGWQMDLLHVGANRKRRYLESAGRGRRAGGAGNHQWRRRGPGITWMAKGYFSGEAT